MAMTITDVLNNWDMYGVFSYVLPFLIIFAVVFGILQKSKIFGDRDVKGINAVLAIAIGLTSLQFDFVSTFFAVIFPRFGVGIAVLLVALILLGLFITDVDKTKGFGGLKGLAWIIIGLVVFWGLSEWNFWGDSFQIGFWLQDYFWAVVVLALIVGGIVAVMKGDK
jgi:hypothetical protein